MEEIIVNKVTSSGIITFDLNDFSPKSPKKYFDIAEVLQDGAILREKPFREFVASNRWEEYKDTYVAIYCSNDAILPGWAFMLLAVAIEPYAKAIYHCAPEQLEAEIYNEILTKHDWNQYKNQRVIVKGCSNGKIPVSAYVQATCKLQKVVQTLMYGEPCSTVPLFKRG